MRLLYLEFGRVVSQFSLNFSRISNILFILNKKNICCNCRPKVNFLSQQLGKKGTTTTAINSINK